MQKVGLSKDGIGEEDFINKMKQYVKCQTLYLGTFFLSTILSVLSFFFNSSLHQSFRKKKITVHVLAFARNPFSGASSLAAELGVGQPTMELIINGLTQPVHFDMREGIHCFRTCQFHLNVFFT